ncbi:MAG: (4Fe-4S)-binding protein, partial [Candidatus Cloacimonetes bacterium]|nr:(4Fe-4S)-binding protein [Candidatus Cloacimonadota bacterium]
PFGVVVNRFGIGDENVQLYCKEENIPIIAQIPNSRKIAELYSEGKLLNLPEFREQLRKVADFISLKKKEFGL